MSKIILEHGAIIHIAFDVCFGKTYEEIKLAWIILTNVFLKYVLQ